MQNFVWFIVSLVIPAGGKENFIEVFQIMTIVRPPYQCNQTITDIQKKIHCEEQQDFS